MNSAHTHTHIYIYIYIVFAHGPGDRPRFNFRPNRTKDSKIVRDSSLLNTQHYKLRIKGKWSNPGKGVALSPTPQLLKREPLGHPRLRSPALLTIYIYISSSSSSCGAASTDIPDHLSPLLPIIHRLRQVLRVTSCVLTQLLYVGLNWSSCFAWPYVGVHRSSSLTSSSLLLQQCPACLVRLTCIVFVMGGKWPYS